MEPIELLLDLLGNGVIKGDWVNQSFGPNPSEIVKQLKGMIGQGKQSRLNADPYLDIERYKVNPYRGYMASKGGIVPEEAIELASRILYDLPSKLLIPEMNPTISEKGGFVYINGQPYTKWGKSAIPVFPKGGEVYDYMGLKKRKTLFGRFFQNIGQGLRQGADNALSMLGADNVIQKSGHDYLMDNNKVYSGVNNFAQSALPAFMNLAAPGSGLIVSGLASAINPEKKQTQNENSELTDLFGGFGNLFGDLGSSLQFDSKALLDMIKNNYGLGQGIGQFTPNLTSIGGYGPSTGTGGYNPLGMLEGIMGKQHRYYRFGGSVNEPPIIPVQTEIGEKMAHLDGTITDVNATKNHSQMDRDDITDWVPSGTYIFSKDSKMKLSRNNAEDYVIGVKQMPYKESQKGKIPEITKFSDIFKKKHHTPAELAELIRKKLRTLETEDTSDFLTMQTNKENLESRMPYLQALVDMSELKRPPNAQEKLQSAITRKLTKSVNESNSFGFGGSPMYPLLAGNGLKIEDIISLGSTIVPFVGSLFGKNKQNSKIDNALPYAGLFANTLGNIQNVRALENAYGKADEGRQQLTSQLLGLNAAGTGVGLAGLMGQETDLPELRYNLSRIQNLNTRVPQSFVDAAGTPTFSLPDVISQLGPNASIGALSNLTSQQMQARNKAASDAFQMQRQGDWQKAQMLTNYGIDQDTRNNSIQQQEISNRNQVTSGIAGTLQGGLSNYGNILGRDYGIKTEFALQRAGLQGLIPKSMGQDLMTLYGLRMMANPNNPGTPGINPNANMTPSQWQQIKKQVLKQQNFLGNQRNILGNYRGNLLSIPETPIYQRPEGYDV